MAIQYYKLQNGQMYQLDKSTGKASQVSSIPSGAGVITWNSSGMPRELENALNTPAPAQNTTQPFVPASQSQSVNQNAPTPGAPSYSEGDLSSMVSTYQWLQQNAKTSADYNLLASIKQKVEAEQNRQAQIKNQAQSLVNSGAGSVGVNEFYVKLPDKDKSLVQQILAGKIDPKYIPQSGNVQTTKLGATGPTTVVGPSVSSNLAPGSYGNDVSELQKWLISQGYNIPSLQNGSAQYGYYGNETKAAVAEWQKAAGVPVPSPDQYGYFGPISQNFLNSGSKLNVGTGDISTGATSTGSAWYDIGSQDPFIKGILDDPTKRAAFDALPDDMKGMFLQTASSLSKAITAGKVVNPNIDITPEQIRQFYDQASGELDPYYKEQFSTLRGGLDLSLARMTEDYTKSIARAQDPFKVSLEEQAESEAQSGTAFSSGRAERQNRLVSNTQNSVTDAFTNLTRNSQDLLRGYEGRAGTTAARSINLPTISPYTVSPSGFTANQSRSIDPNLLGGITYGTLGADQKTAVLQRQNQLEQAYRTTRVLDYSPL